VPALRDCLSVVEQRTSLERAPRYTAETGGREDTEGVEADRSVGSEGVIFLGAFGLD